MAEDGQKTKDEEQERREAEEVEHRASPGGRIVYKSVMHEADEELGRASAALFWSGLAAGLSMGLSLVAEGVLRHHLPDAPWRVLVSKLGYSVGFVAVILGRQQLFTENTLTPILPLLQRKDGKTLANVGRLWGIVLVANLLGALAFGLVAARTDAFEAGQRGTFIQIGHEAMAHGWWTLFVRAVFAGWLVALLVWMLPYAESSHFFVIVLVTWLIGAAEFAHIVAGAVGCLRWGGRGRSPGARFLGITSRRSCSVTSPAA
jgi:formate/nitrite transporter FocA (FNT family)